MDYAVSVTDTSIATKIENDGVRILEILDTFERQLSELTAIEQPRGMIFHDLKSAIQLYSTVPIPAYTSRNLIHIVPDPKVWKKIFLSTTGGLKEPEAYYASVDHIEVAKIAGHELVHHSDFFHIDFDDPDDENMWFEEGMCEYVPNKLMLSTDGFDQVMKIEDQLIQHYKEEYGEYNLGLFGDAGYRSGKRKGYAAAFYDYWRSAQVVRFLVESCFDNDLSKLVDSYKNWVNGSREEPLRLYFVNELGLSKELAKSKWLID